MEQSIPDNSIGAESGLPLAEGYSPLDVEVRSFSAADLAECRVLYREGLIGGKIAENDTALDIDDIESAYMQVHGNQFWVAESSDGKIVGMIGVQRDEDSAAEIRRLRVRQDSRRRGVGSKLLERAIQFCHENNYLKLTLDTFMDREPALRLFEKFHFRHSRTRDVAGKQLMYFYLDLYQQGKR